MSRFLFLSLFFLFFSSAFCQVYLHNPPGSNNRNREISKSVKNQQRLFDSSNEAVGGYSYHDPLSYYSGSILHLQWTAAQMCGKTSAVSCNIVIQYVCNDTQPNLHDGVCQSGTSGNCTDTVNPDGTSTPSQADEANPRYTVHEPFDYYDLCSKRERNRGLFGGPVILNGSKATSTRQNSFGTRHGWECPEERDYYPYWHPSIWKDIVILTDDARNRCDGFTKESQNVVDKGSCSAPEYNYPFLCKSNGGDWKNSGKFGIAAPKCTAAPWSAPNSLGVTSTGQPYNYNWTLPTTSTPLQCVLRIRYNVTSTDIPTTSDGQMNARFSPFQNDMQVQLDANRDPNIWSNLTLGTNGRLIGKTFQDRSYVFNIIPRPPELNDKAIYNLNVRGKRGNLVDIFPALTYDFVPNPLLMYHDNFVHIQWSGSNYNLPFEDLPGLPGTDRHNLVQIQNRGSNYPLPLTSWTMFNRFSEPFKTTISTRLATADQTISQCNSNSPATDCSVLNLAPAVFSAPPVQINEGEYDFMCTRNNRFGQAIMKGTIFVFDNDPNVYAYAVPIAIILGVLFSLICIFGLIAYKNPAIIKPQQAERKANR